MSSTDANQNQTTKVDWDFEAHNIPTDELTGLLLNPTFFGKRWAKYLNLYNGSITGEDEIFRAAIRRALSEREDRNPYIFDEVYFE